MSHDDKGHIALTAQQWPWSVLQVVQATPDTFDSVVEKCNARGGIVAKHDTDRTFCIIHLTSGDMGGKYPKHHIDIDGLEAAEKFFEVLKDCMVQAAVWYHVNVTICNMGDK